jgi:hypothetical protein
MESDSAGVIQENSSFILYVFLCRMLIRSLPHVIHRRIWRVRRRYCRVNKSRKYSAVDWKGAAI